MDYKYKQALERAQKLQENSNGMILKKWLWCVFPELQENTDERIRKGLIKAVSGILKGNTLYGTDVTREEAIAWLEKQGEQKSTLPKWKYKKDNIPLLRDSLILNKYGCVAKSPSGAIVSDVWVLDYDELAKLPKEELEKQGEKKPADKVEPKFHEDDWIIFNGLTLHIDEVVNGYYRTTSRGDGIHNSYDWDIDNAARLWTIQDAKDGDVLASEDKDKIFLYNGKLDLRGRACAYCGIYKTYDGLRFAKCTVGNYFTYKEPYPTTKEQRDTLFAKMADAGYEWDTDKKELKKIEQKPAESTKDYNDIDPHFGIPAEDLMSTDKAESKFKVGNWYQCTKDFFGKGVTFDKNTAYYCAKEGCLLNGCHIAIVKDLYDNFKLWTIQDAKDGDVLLEEETGEPFIYNGNRATYFSGYFLGAYCGIYNGEFNPYGNIHHWGKNSCPATKEQRDLLFQKMKEAGYEWDSEKKELKKIEPEFEGDNILSTLGNNQVQDILEDMGLLDDNGRCPHTAEEIFKAGMEHAFNLNREAASSVKIDVKNI